ncbi:MAG: WXG100 family type VII secretion target [Chloroflexi bacterium]|nr:WXG100 family type VII secretion target [Chloroflexota bacterium]
MSPQAIADPEELEQFSRELKQFNAQLRDSMARLQGHFSNLGETWRDQEHQKFAQEFQQTMRVLNHFTRTADEQIPFLMRKAAHLRNYKSQR